MALGEYLPLVAALAVTVSLAAACSLPADRTDQPVEERAKVPLWIVYGTVVSDQLPTSGADRNGSVEKEYKVHVQPLCWLKKKGPRPDKTDDDGPDITDDVSGKDGENSGEHGPVMDRSNSTAFEVDFGNITVVEIKIDCFVNELKKGKKYIIFLKKLQVDDTFFVHDVNEQSGAIEEPRDESFQAVYRGIGAALKGEPQGDCMKGVEVPCFVGEVDRSVCGGAQAIGSMSFMVLAIALVAAVIYM